MIDSVRRIDQKRQPPQQRKKKPAMPTNAMASNRETIRKIIASKKPIWRFNLFHLKSLRNFHFHESLSLWKLNVLLFFVFFVSIASSISALSLSLKPLSLDCTSPSHLSLSLGSRLSPISRSLSSTTSTTADCRPSPSPRCRSPLQIGSPPPPPNRSRWVLSAPVCGFACRFDSSLPFSAVCRWWFSWVAGAVTVSIVIRRRERARSCCLVRILSTGRVVGWSPHSRLG